MSKRAELENARGIRLEEEGRPEEAAAAYRTAASLDPAWSVPWFNLGLLAKRQGRWSESLDFSSQAVELDPSDQGAWWNLGIAATAVGDWSTARRAWAGCGLKLPDGDGPLEVDMGLVPIRISTNGEVIWGRRIDPARAIVQSVPLPESGRAFGDLLLHDGAANGWRWVDAQRVPVFDELQRLRPSSFLTFALKARVSSPADVEALADLAYEAGGAAEDWSTINHICEACSKGTPHKHHLHEAPEWHPERNLGVASSDRGSLDRLLAAWQEQTKVAISDVEPVPGGAR